MEASQGQYFSEEELRQLDDLISPLMKKLLSIQYIFAHNPDLIPWSERILYTIVSHNLLDARNLDLARKVRRMPRKKEKEIKIDRKCRVNRISLDFTALLSAKSYPPVVQMDTVEGIQGGGNLLTLLFETSGLMLAFKRSVNNSLSVIQILNSLDKTLGTHAYASLFEVILTDSGIEFCNPSALELSPDGHQRSHVFYCDPNSPYQKGAIERYHALIRMIVSKGIDFDRYTQALINTMMNHIKSYARKKRTDHVESVYAPSLWWR